MTAILCIFNGGREVQSHLSTTRQDISNRGLMKAYLKPVDKLVGVLPFIKTFLNSIGM